MAHEIEIKVIIENVQPLLDFLRNNAEFKSESRQLDEYFGPAHRNFLAVHPLHEWLRLREANGQYSINYKNWHIDEQGRSNYCDEYETKIDSIENMRQILQALDFKPLVTVDKIRQIWNYQDYEIGLDTVKGLGDFVEIEFKGPTGDPVEITNGMIQFLKERDCGKMARDWRGYPYLLLFPEEKFIESI